jgi:c-di-GMP-binding flagellar brake protein YcgR
MGIFQHVLSYLKPEKAIVIDEKEHNKRLLAEIHRYAPLIRLQDERRLVEVIIDEKAYSYQSMIIGVDLYHQRLIIDELSPLIQNPNTLEGKAVIIHHQNHQQLLKITSKIITWNHIERTLIIDLPKNVEYQPRRQHKRFIVNRKSPLNAVIDPIYGAPWHTSIDNISLGGVRVIAMGDLRNQLHKNKALRKCEITMYSGQKICCQGRVKSFTYLRHPCRRTEISIEFEGLHNEILFKLEELIDQTAMAY